MSKALDYLMQTRPRAMNNYFGFIKEAGKHLDPRTRAIISIITKVDNQTEAGFRQYLKRALEQGVTADEILDGLLFAFPTLGLTKIVWAMDILLQMDIPEFRPENLDLNAEWHEVMNVSELPQATAICARADGKLLFIIGNNESVQVYESKCPHQGTILKESDLEGSHVTCPKHRWKFDLETGACIENGTLPLPKIDCRVENGMLYARW